MSKFQLIVAFSFITGCAVAVAQQTSQVELKIEPTNRTLTVSAEGQVTVDPDVAILHIGFETQPSDAKAAYAAGAKTSNDIVNALKQAGIPETSIHSEWQRLDRVFDKTRKYKLVQQWTVKTPPARVAEILDIAVAAGATESGQIDWTMENMRTLEDQALDSAAVRARADAEVLAKGMGVHLGALIYVTNQISVPQSYPAYYADRSAPTGAFAAAPSAPLAIEPRKVSRTATVYTVFAIE